MTNPSRSDAGPDAGSGAVPDEEPVPDAGARYHGAPDPDAPDVCEETEPDTKRPGKAGYQPL